jgi:prepilin-type processing-associated H-X9-DG protein
MRKTLIVVVTLLCALAWAQVARAQALADKVPADALIFASWRGEADLGDAFTKSNFNGLLEATKARQQITDLLTQALDRAAKDDAAKAEGGKTVRDLMTLCWKEPSAFYFGGMDFSNPDKPLPKLALLCRAGKDGAALVERMGKIIEGRSAADKQTPMVAKMVGDTLIVGVGHTELVEALLGDKPDGKALLTDPDFVSALKQVQPNAALTVYVNVDGLIQMFEDIVTQKGPEQAKVMIPKVIDFSGISALKRAIYTGNFVGANWSITAFIAMDEKRVGLAGLLDSKPLSAEALAAIPKGALWATTVRLDGPRLLAELRDSAGRIDPNGVPFIDGSLNRANMALGIDIEKDLLAVVSDEWLAYGSADAVGNSIRGATLVNKLKDEATARKTFANIEAFINGMIALRMPAAQAEKMQMKATTVDGVEIHSMTLPQGAPSWAISGGYLAISLSPQGVQSALAAAQKKDGGLAKNPAFADLLAQMKVPAIAAFTYVDLPSVAPESYELLTQAQAQMASAAQDAGDGIKVPTLPPLEKIKPFLAPALVVKWTDEAGMHARGIEPFPGALSAGGPGLAVQGMMADAMKKARGQARQTASMANLHQIGVAGAEYSADHDGTLPPDLGSTLPYVGGKLNVFLLPGEKVPAEIAKGTDDQKKAWVNDHSSYVFVKPGVKISNILKPAETIVVHQKFKADQKGSVPVLFADGHVEQMPIATVQETVRAQTVEN